MEQQLQRNIETNTIKTLQVFKEIASDPLKQIPLVREQASIQFLVYVLEDANTEVVILALQTLKILTQTRDVCRMLLQIFGVLESVEAFFNRKQSNEEVAKLILDINKNLRAVREMHTLPHSLNRTSHVRKDERTILGTAKKRTKLLVFRIEGLISPIERKLCEEKLLLVKGIISFTFNMNKSLCILRTRLELEPKVIAAAIAQTGMMTAVQIMKDRKGQEIFITFNISKSRNDSTSSMQLPDYLPEDDSPQVSDKALARPGGFRETTTGWLNSAANFFTRSFW